MATAISGTPFPIQHKERAIAFLLISSKSDRLALTIPPHQRKARSW
ncbi:hypothetical protein H6F98_21270 [Microcoleus sp. FACHB-SPT15]|nr:hypothetical protein [Microcoleus sp. FACHB-SPT15]MBD1807963.1 hypothetical protein [Microcoleus sp. FACHB-SPT15]